MNDFGQHFTEFVKSVTVSSESLALSTRVVTRCNDLKYVNDVDKVIIIPAVT